MEWEGRVMWVAALFPFSEESPRGENADNWHIVLFDKWFNTGLKVRHPKYKTYIACDDDTLSFCREWGKPNTSDYGKVALEHPEDYQYASFYYWKGWQLPTYRILQEKYYIKNGQWKKNVAYNKFKCSWEDEQKFEKEQDVYKAQFSFMDGNEKVPVKVKVTGAKRVYCWWWLPQWLTIKPLIREEVWIEFSTDIGKDRGSWKGGTVGRGYPFTNSLRDSWRKFKKEELPKYIKGEL